MEFHFETKFIYTVFTSTFNRGELLNRIYQALCNQTFTDFEWIIIDDGSTDKTSDIVKSFIQENLLSIKYYYQENSGKHTAYKPALNLSEGYFFLPLDSDDVPLPDALENLLNAYVSIPNNEKHRFSAVTGLCIDKSGKVIGNKYPKDIFDATPLDAYFKYKVTGDKWGFQKTNIRKQYTFPIEPDQRFIADMKFYPEIALFGEIGRKYKTRYINIPVKIVEYSKDGFSKNKITHAYSKKLSALYKINYCGDYFRYAIKEFIINMLLYNRWSLHTKTIKYAEIKSVKLRIFTILLFPVSAFIFLLDKTRY